MSALREALARVVENWGPEALLRESQFLDLAARAAHMVRGREALLAFADGVAELPGDVLVYLYETHTEEHGWSRGVDVITREPGHVMAVARALDADAEPDLLPVPDSDREMLCEIGPEALQSERCALVFRGLAAMHGVERLEYTWRCDGKASEWVLLARSIDAELAALGLSQG